MVALVLVGEQLAYRTIEIGIEPVRHRVPQARVDPTAQLS